MPCGSALARRSAVLLGAIAAVCATAVPAAAVPTYVRNEPALAVATPSTVYLEATYTGYLRDSAAGTLLSREPVVVTRRCTGVVVNPDGYAVTTTVCIQPSREVLLVNALYRYGRTLVQENGLAADELDAYVGRLRDSSAFTGQRRGTAPARTLVGQVEPATPDITSAPAVPAAVTEALAPVDGNAALVKLRRSGVPAIEMAAADLTLGVPLLILGFGRDEATDGSVRYVVRNRAVEVVGPSGTNRTGVSGQIGPDSRGGPVVDAAGRLVAVLDTDTSAAGEPISDLITVATIGRLLDQAGVGARLSEVDLGYRAALKEYFAGRYGQAVRRFDAVLQQDPAHPAARTYRERAEERLRLDGNATENSANWLLYLLSAAGGALVIGAVGLVQRSSIRPAPTAATAGADGRRHGGGLRPPDRPAPVAPPRAHPPVQPARAPAHPPGPPTDDDATQVFSLDDTVVLPLDRTAILPRVDSEPRPGEALPSARPTAPAPLHGRYSDWRGHHDRA